MEVGEVGQLPSGDSDQLREGARRIWGLPERDLNRDVRKHGVQRAQALRRQRETDAELASFGLNALHAVDHEPLRLIDICTKRIPGPRGAFDR